MVQNQPLLFTVSYLYGIVEFLVDNESKTQGEFLCSDGTGAGGRGDPVHGESQPDYQRIVRIPRFQRHVDGW